MATDLVRYAAGNARSRALLARLLGRSGLEALYTYPSSATLVEALQRTPYADVLTGSDHPDLQLTGRLTAIGRTLLAWLAGAERNFIHEYLLRYEVENLEIVIRMVHAQLAWERIAPALVPLGEMATIDARELARAPDVPALVSRLAGSRYGAAAYSALHRLPQAGPFALEVAVELDYYDRLWGATALLRAGDVPRARQLLGGLYDILNLGWIARYRDVWALSPEEILNYTLRQGQGVTLDVRRRLAEDRSGGWQHALAQTPYADYGVAIETQGFDAVSPLLWRRLAMQVQNGLSGYPFHIGVPLGLLILQEIEIRDLRVLLAAKQLEVPPAEVPGHLSSVRH
jgi:vacuolar-type H+-ATPase subunit C/Vma6